MIRLFSQYVSPKSVLLMLLEGGLITLALLCGVKIRFWDNAHGFESYVGLPEFSLQAAVFVATILVCFYYCDLYSLRSIRGRNEQAIAVGQSLGSGCLLLGMVYFMFPALVLSRGVFFISLALVPAFIIFSRFSLDWIWRATWPVENVIIMGTERLACVVWSELARRNDLSINVVGFVSPANASSHPLRMAGHEVLGSCDDLESIVCEHRVSRIIVALEDRRNALPIRDLVRLRVQGIRVEDAHSTISALTGRVWLETVKPSWFVFSDGFRRSTVTSVFKRAIDLACGIAGLAMCAPIMLLAAVMIRLDSKGPFIFRQTRVGLGGKTFEVLKFRSMRVDAEQNGAQWATKNDQRVTRLGRVLRKYRLDELPQFINVIRGEMSLVGPRPERPEFVNELRKHISYYDERHSVRPGLTGWAQVQYHYGSTVEDAARKLEYDLFYLKNMSLLFDLVVLFDTVRIVLTGHGSR